jgi:DNA-binding transcriptional ArsR family regulator
MMEFVLSIPDTARIRFGVSPLVELMGSLRALASANADPIHAEWRDAAWKRVGERSFSQLAPIVRGRYIPEVLAAPLREPSPSLSAELECLKEMPRTALRVSFEDAFPDGVPPTLTSLYEDGGRALEALVDRLLDYWDRALAPWWAKLDQLLRDDIYSRLRQIESTGLAGMFDDIHPDIVFEGESVRLSHWYERRCPLDGQGLMLIPSAFAWPQLHTISDSPLQPALIYPALGVGLLWAPEPLEEHGMAAVVGATRFQVLNVLTTPRTGKEIARALGVTQSAISQQLAVLRAAGLVRTNRHGRSTIASRTPLGDAVAGRRSSAAA